jgi:hypothetical protein
MLQDFRAPSGKLVLLTHIGGLVSAAVLVASLQWLSVIANRKPNSPGTTSQPQPSLTLAQLDERSLQTPGQSVDVGQSAVAIPTSAAQPALTVTELQMAQQAWQYFIQNTHSDTGLVNGVAGQNSVTMADVAATLAALLSARELEIISPAEFDQRLGKVLGSLAQLPLYQDALPNQAYNSQNLAPIAPHQADRPQETGWSALDIGRLARWFKVVATRYPQWQPQIEQIWQAWQVDQLTQSGHLYEATQPDGESLYQQQGRLGYESYAAYGLNLWGLPVQAALDIKTHVQFVNLYGQGIAIDTRSDQVSSPQVSDPYLWDGLETGFQALPKGYADRLLAAQTARHQATQKLTAVAQDNLDRAPYRLRNTFYANQKPWQSLNQQDSYPDFRGFSTKAAIAWHVLYRNDYTQKLYQFAQGLGSDRGWYSGFYETLNQPNQALTADTNAMILTSLLYQKVNQPLLTWAGVKPPPIDPTSPPES